MGTKPNVSLPRLRKRFLDYSFGWYDPRKTGKVTDFCWCHLKTDRGGFLGGSEFTEQETYVAVEAILEMRRKPVDTLKKLKAMYPEYEFYWEKTEPGKPDALCWEEPPRGSGDFQCYTCAKCKASFMEVDRMLRDEEEDYNE